MASRVARGSSDYPLLSGGDTNLNSLFIERAHALVKPRGMVGLLVPSGIASDQSSAGFFRKITDERRLSSVIDFFNKRADGTLFFPDVYYRFKFCAYVAAGSIITENVPADALAIARGRQANKPGWAAERRAEQKRAAANAKSPKRAAKPRCAAAAASVCSMM